MLADGRICPPTLIGDWPISSRSEARMATYPIRSELGQTHVEVIRRRLPQYKRSGERLNAAISECLSQLRANRP